MTEDKTKSVGSSGSTTESAKPDPDPILKEFPEIKKAEDKQEKERTGQQKK